MVPHDHGDDCVFCSRLSHLEDQMKDLGKRVRTLQFIVVVGTLLDLVVNASKGAAMGWFR